MRLYISLLKGASHATVTAVNDFEFKRIMPPSVDINGRAANARGTTGPLQLASRAIFPPRFLSPVCIGVRSLEVSEAKRGPPQQLSSWQSSYTKRLDALGFFESSDLGGYTYPSELVRKSVEPSSEEDESAWDPEREEDGCEDADDDEVDEGSGETEDEVSESLPPVVPQYQDLER